MRVCARVVAHGTAAAVHSERPPLSPFRCGAQDQAPLTRVDPDLVASLAAAGAGRWPFRRRSPCTPALRLGLAGDVPMALETLHVPAALSCTLDAARLGRTGLHGLLTGAGAPLAGSTQRVEATGLEAEEARLLEMPLHSPAFLLERPAHDATGRPIEFDRGDPYGLVVQLLLPEPGARR